MNRYLNLTFNNEGSIRIPDNVDTGNDLFNFIDHHMDAENMMDQIYLISSGNRSRIIHGCSSLSPLDTSINAVLRLDGGKGGFGSMLRAIGAQIEKTTNKESCRDLSGRRIRDINQEKRLKEQIEKRDANELERVAAKKRKYEKLKEKPKYMLSPDDTIFEDMKKQEQSMDDAIRKGLKHQEEEAKKLAAAPKAVRKKTKYDDDLDCSSSDDDEIVSVPVTSIPKASIPLAKNIPKSSNSGTGSPSTIISIAKDSSEIIPDTKDAGTIVSVTNIQNTRDEEVVGIPSTNVSETSTQVTTL